MLRAESIHVSLGNPLKGNCPLLTAVDLSVKPGSVLAVVGPNGAGKTSLLKTLSGEMAPSAGRVMLQDRRLSDWPPEQRARLLGILPQQSTLGFPFRVDEVVALGRYPHATGKQRDEAIVDKALSTVDASHLKARTYTTLSGGEKQRVHLARVLAQVWEASPLGERYLLLDEPTAALDLAHQHMILQTARDMAKQGVGVLVILHDLNLAAHYADWLVMLKHGKIVASGDAHQVLTAEHIAEVFGISVSLMVHPQAGCPLIVHNEVVARNNPDEVKQ